MNNHNLALVSGANGHLGNNLVRLLLKKVFRYGLQLEILKIKNLLGVELRSCSGRYYR